MQRNRWHFLVVPFLLAAAGAAPRGDVERLAPEAARMHACVKRPHPGELKWQQIPWLIDLQRGVRQTKEDKLPLLLFVSGDEPLENC